MLNDLTGFKHIYIACGYTDYPVTIYMESAKEMSPIIRNCLPWLSADRKAVWDLHGWRCEAMHFQ